MGDFSVSPTRSLAESLAKGYVGVHIQQGVPLRDEDLNLLGDLVMAAARVIATGYIGSGVAAGRDGFAISGTGLDNDFRIGAGPGGGSCLVDGIEVAIAAPLSYSAQPGVPALTAPDASQPNPRTDIVYLDVWLADVESDTDPLLENPADVGVATSTRVRPAWQVRVAQGSDVVPGALAMPVPQEGHAHYPLARLTRGRNQTPIAAQQVTDLRQRNLTVSAVEGRVRLLEEALLLPRFEDIPGQGRPFTPPLGAPGTVVHLFGHNFRVGSTAVSFGTETSPSVTPVSDTEITATVPAISEGPVTLTVTTSGGSATTEDTFNVLPASGNPPVIAAPGSEFTPPLGAPGTTVTIAGSNFDGPQLQVTFAAAKATITSSTATSVVVTVPPPAAAGGVKITVKTQFGSDTTVNNFTVL